MKKAKKVVQKLSCEQAARELNLPLLAMPQLAIDGVLKATPGLEFFSDEIDRAKSLDLSRYR